METLAIAAEERFRQWRVLLSESRHLVRMIEKVLADCFGVVGVTLRLLPTVTRLCGAGVRGRWYGDGAPVDAGWEGVRRGLWVWLLDRE